MVEKIKEDEETVQMTFQTNKSVRERFKENTDNMSETLRWIMRNYAELEDRYDIGQDTDKMNIILLKTYRNAIQQQINVMENQVDRINEEIDSFKKRDDDEDGEVILEIDLDMEKKTI